MTLHARAVLEFDQVLAAVAERAGSPQARSRILGLTPRDVPSARRELDRVRDAMDFVDEKPGWGLPPIPSAEGSLQRLEVEGSVLEPAELVRVGAVLAASSTVQDEFDERGELAPALADLARRLWVAPELEVDVTRTVDGDGGILDSASPELRRIRSRLRGAHQRIVRHLEGYMGGLPERIRVPDASVSVREGRYVIPVRREGRREVGGIVHDESGTGATIFVEPPVAVELMNELRDLEREEQREIRRILRAFSDRLRPFRHDLASTLDALVDLDGLLARARTATAWRAHPPELADDAHQGWVIRNGRHPLLLLSGAQVVPFDLELAPHERTLVVSGPNTGGKSVFLKAVGLLVLLAQSGVVPPVGKGTRLPGVSQVFADIGDEQSIRESLSTFSGHLTTARTILAEADRNALVLLDELGTGTDPAEGAALARAVLEALTERGCLTLASSHLGALKALDTEGSGVVNASLQFDSREMAPTYRLQKGRPGRSYGLAIARRLGLPREVLARAEAFLEDGSARVEELLAKLEVREREARERAEALEAAQARADALVADVEARERRLEERERTQEARSREQARQLLLHARSEVESAIEAVRTAPEEERDEAARKARHRVERAAQRQADRKPGRPEPSPARRGTSLEIGARVRVGSTTTRGTLVETRDDRGVLDVSGLRMEVPLADLIPLEGGDGGSGRRRGAGVGGGGGRSGKGPGTASRKGSEKGAGPSGGGSGGWSGPMPEGRYEIDLRGLRVDEVEWSLGRSLDGAIVAELHEVRIIHGKGTGAVKGRVLEILEQDERVASFRGGQPGEGGSGVTVAVFR